jgi:hypothetical protein
VAKLRNLGGNSKSADEKLVYVIWLRCVIIEVMNRLHKVFIKWSPAFAYCIGLIASDGNLSKDGRHIVFTSKDEELVETFRDCLGLKNKVSYKGRGGSKDRKYSFLQFGDKNFYEFLLKIGLTPAKSKTIGPLKINEMYFADFLRGVLDGDGNINIFRHPESRRPQLRVRFFSASSNFINWIQGQNMRLLHIKGFQRETNGEIDLAYATADSVKLLNFMYYVGCKHFLKRKHEKAMQFFKDEIESSILRSRGGEIGKRVGPRSRWGNP